MTQTTILCQRALHVLDTTGKPKLVYGLSVSTDLVLITNADLAPPRRAHQDEQDAAWAMPLVEATRGTIVPVDTNVFVALAYAYGKRRVFVLHEDSNTHIRLTGHAYTLIIVQPHVDATVVLDHAAKAFSSSVVEVLVLDNARCTVLSLKRSSAPTVCHHAAHVNAHAHMHWVDCVMDGSLVLGETTSTLLQEHASARHAGVFLGTGSQTIDLGSTVVHAAPVTQSDVIMKGAVAGKATALYRGLIKINGDAPGSNGYQKSDVIILDETAKANAIPTLEIHNYDVRCSHGASTGHLDEEKLFYLQSRGLPQKAAKHIILEGFFTPFLQLFTPELQQELNDALQKKLVTL